MARVENAIIDELLRLARMRAPDSETGGDRLQPDAAPKAVHRREAQFSDFQAVAALKASLGLAPDSAENWQRLWHHNPALRQTGVTLPIGWIQETDDGEVVGYLGSVPLLYQYGQQRILATATTAYAVDPAYRPRSLGLVGSFFRQDPCDLYLDTTATPPAGRIMAAFKAHQVPQRDYGTVLFWILDAQAFLRAAVRKFQVSENLGSIAAFLASPILSGDNFFRWRRLRSGSARLSCRTLRVEEIGDDFQDLWIRKLQEKARLFAWRTPEVLQWHFQIPHSKRTPHVLACFSNGRMEGYMILVIGRDRSLGLQKAVVADLMAAGDSAPVIRDLLAGAHEIAKTNSCDVLEVLGFPEEVRRICAEGKPYKRNYPACPFFYKTQRPDLLDTLTREESWYACPFDGDATLSP